MHGLINKAVQTFVCHTYGNDRWASVASAVGLEPPEFEAMLWYDDALTDEVLDALRRELARNLDDVLEDLGIYLISDPEVARLRRLLRFSGVTYVDFLHSLDDLPDRARLAVADLNLPTLELREYPAGKFSLTVGSGIPGFANVMMGILRTMADDYGALAFIEYKGRSQGSDVIAIRLVDVSFTKGREFDLGAAAP